MYSKHRTTFLVVQVRGRRRSMTELHCAFLFIFIKICTNMTECYFRIHKTHVGTRNVQFSIFSCFSTETQSSSCKKCMSKQMEMKHSSPTWRRKTINSHPSLFPCPSGLCVVRNLKRSRTSVFPPHLYSNDLDQTSTSRRVILISSYDFFSFETNVFIFKPFIPVAYNQRTKHTAYSKFVWFLAIVWTTWVLVWWWLINSRNWLPICDDTAVYDCMYSD